MPTIAGELRTCTEDATQCGDLVDFSCGDGRLVAERTVERIVASLRSDRRRNATVRITREVPGGALVGLVAIEWPGIKVRHADFPSDAYSDAAYIAVITLSNAFRGGYVSQAGQPLGEVLLEGALGFIASRNDGDIPPVQAIIEEENKPSRDLFERYGFEQPIVTNPDLWYVRPRGLSLPR